MGGVGDLAMGTEVARSIPSASGVSKGIEGEEEAKQWGNGSKTAHRPPYPVKDGCMEALGRRG